MSIEVGNLVKIKSGGPIMTVSSLDPKNVIWCVWWWENQYHTSKFKGETLIAAAD